MAEHDVSTCLSESFSSSVFNFVLDRNNDLPDKDMFPELQDFHAKNVRNLIFGHLNINSFHSKFMEVYEILSKRYMDIFVISEIKLNKSYLSGQYNVKDYSMYRADRLIADGGGGLIVYVNPCLPHRERHDIAFNQDGIESIVMEVMVKKEKWFFIHIYRPPRVSITFLRDSVDYMYQKCNYESKTIFVLGDLNVDFLKGKNPLQDTLDVFNLKNVIVGPTCFKSMQSPTAVDVILTNYCNRINSHLNINIGVSDFHSIIVASSKTTVKKYEKREICYRSYKSFNQEQFINDLQEAPFHVSTIFDDVNDQLWFHNSLLDDIIERHAPRKKRVIKTKQLACMNGQLRKMINVKGMLRRKYDKCKSNSSWLLYKTARNKVTTLKGRH